MTAYNYGLQFVLGTNLLIFSPVRHRLESRRKRIGQRLFRIYPSSF